MADRVPVKLYRHSFGYEKGYNAPYLKDIHRAILAWYKKRDPSVNWEIRIKRARENFSTTKYWGSILFHKKSCLLYCGSYPYQAKRKLSHRLMAWGLIYPDYLLCAYPKLPLGRALDLTNQKDMYSFNPYYLRPSEWWGLPKEVYDHFLIRCGEREKPICYNKKTITEYETKRREYITYFCKQAKINPKFFDSLESKPEPMKILTNKPP